MNYVKPTMLIIDDDTHSAKRYSRVFNPYFDCVTTYDGETGLELFQSSGAHVVLCDLSLPGTKNGFDICKHVKSSSPEVIVVLTSAYCTAKNRITGLELRADDFINKLLSEKETYLKITNLYSTKKNIPADFEEFALPLPENISENSFESQVRNILLSFYNKPLHDREPNRITLKYIAREMAKSQRTIQRDFANEVGCKFIEFHTAVRMEIATRKLEEDKHLSIGEISEMLCFGSPSNFSREFKSFSGLTPSNYRSNSFQ